MFVDTRQRLSAHPVGQAARDRRREPEAGRRLRHRADARRAGAEGLRGLRLAGAGRAGGHAAGRGRGAEQGAGRGARHARRSRRASRPSGSRRSRARRRRWRRTRRASARSGARSSAPTTSSSSEHGASAAEARPVALDRTVTHRLHTLQQADRPRQPGGLPGRRRPAAERGALPGGGRRVLAAVGERPRAARQPDKGQASRAAQSLVDQGLVRKEASATDGRGVVLTLTAKGERAWRRVMDVIEQPQRRDRRLPRRPGAPDARCPARPPDRCRSGRGWGRRATPRNRKLRQLPALEARGS